ncbi:hypothetical protein E2I00_013097, partial [Balaenoptera physalus]
WSDWLRSQHFSRRPTYPRMVWNTAHSSVTQPPFCFQGCISPLDCHQGIGPAVCSRGCMAESCQGRPFGALSFHLCWVGFVISTIMMRASAKLWLCCGIS